MDALLYIGIGVGVFLVVLSLLLSLLLIARKKLVLDKNLIITINDSKKIQTSYSTKIIDSLSSNGIYLPSACGGGGSCGMCKLKILTSSSYTPIDRSLIDKDLLDKGYRLACQYSVKDDVSIEIPDSIMNVKKQEFKVVSNIQKTDLIHEIRLVPNEGNMFNFRVGDYIQVEYLKDDEKYVRGYSMVNSSLEKEELILNVRLAVPPKNTRFPVGVVSSFLTSRKKGDLVCIMGPYGEFHIKEDENECIYIAGGVGLASIRAHVIELLKARNSKKKISLWYGIRTINDGYYVEEFENLARDNDNFSYNIVLSNESLDEINSEYIKKYKGINFYEGFVHDACYNHYLKEHLDPYNINYYFCGPPIMNQKIHELLEDLGVSKNNIFCDDFGA